MLLGQHFPRTLNRA